MADDIPEALRDPPSDLESQSPLSRDKWLMWGLVALVGLAVLALGGSLGWLWQSQQQPISTPPADNAPTSSVSSPPRSETNIRPLGVSEDDLLGHLPYEIAPTGELEPIVADGRLKLRQGAAEEYLAMEAAARAQGVILAPISAFRTLEDQEFLFFGVKAERGQGATERAEVSAPPGYSEHHTGYAIDIGDGNVPAMNLMTEFENTAAFRWLQKNASYYSFELSFPKGNSQGVAYEPWHWRFVGDRHSLETFYKAHSLE